ncbi:unnamed protein product [Rangifer tarandus platyrhynchus]|uniref:Uncharacterized protein n=1 Tax=Rangifer tarandus platyrhynchus TaxID=3082113 RepID=A0ABN8ZUK8_RANTA|nr:unnamed protein product [Rangifer tarandus platyrhynchus]
MENVGGPAQPGSTMVWGLLERGRGPERVLTEKGVRRISCGHLSSPSPQGRASWDTPASRPAGLEQVGLLLMPRNPGSALPCRFPSISPSVKQGEDKTGSPASEA